MIGAAGAAVKTYLDVQACRQHNRMPACPLDTSSPHTVPTITASPNTALLTQPDPCSCLLPLVPAPHDHHASWRLTPRAALCCNRHGTRHPTQPNGADVQLLLQQQQASQHTVSVCRYGSRTLLSPQHIRIADTDLSCGCFPTAGLYRAVLV